MVFHLLQSHHTQILQRLDHDEFHLHPLKVGWQYLMSRIVARSVFDALTLYGVKTLDVFSYFLVDSFAKFVIKRALMHKKLHLIVCLQNQRTSNESVVSVRF